MTTTRPTAHAPHAYHSLPGSPDGEGPRPGALARVEEAVETSQASAGTAARWAGGVVGLGMFASAATYGARGDRPAEQGAALAGGLFGLTLFGAGIHDVLSAAHLEGPAGGPATHLAHHAGLSLAGVAVGCALSAVHHPIVGLFGALGAYFSAFWATSTLTAQLAWREARWREAGAGEAHGNRFLTAGVTLLLVTTALFAWFGAALVTAAGHGSPAAVTGRLVGAEVTFLAALQVLPRLLCGPGRRARRQELEPFS